MAQINPPKQVIFGNGKPYVGQYNKPYADIVLVGTKRIAISNVVVDTGADFLQVPQSAASNAGLNLGQAIKQMVKTVSGTITMLRLPNVLVEIEGIRIITVVLCNPNGTSSPLLGRAALHRLVNVGFDASQWLWS